MSANKATPYLFFNGNAQDAIALYERALGAKLEMKQLYGEVCGESCPDAEKSNVIHAALHLGESLIMISDAPKSNPVPPESNVSVAIDFESVDELTRSFEALSVGGKVKHPLQDAFWGDKFGVLTDAFGICWMFTARLKRPTQAAA